MLDTTKWESFSLSTLFEIKKGIGKIIKLNTQWMTIEETFCLLKFVNDSRTRSISFSVGFLFIQIPLSALDPILFSLLQPTQLVYLIDDW